MSFYLDASAILPTLIEEDASAAIDAFVLACEGEFIVSDFAAAEVASALSRLIRTAELTAEDASERLADFDAWRAAATSDIDVQASDIRLANVFVRRFELRCAPPMPSTPRYALAAATTSSPWITVWRTPPEELGVSVVTPK